MADDDDLTIRTLQAWREKVGALVNEHRGRLVDFTGDNFLAEFPAARDAVACAVEIQQVMEARNLAIPEPRRMRFRIGAHLGDVRVEGERVFGDGVNVAARLQAIAEPGGLCLSAAVVEQVRGKFALDFEDIGEQVLKNLPAPVHAFRVRPGSPDARPQPVAPGRPKDRGAHSRIAAVVMIGVATILVALAAGVAVVLFRGHSASPVASDLTNGRVEIGTFRPLTSDEDAARFAAGLRDTLAFRFSGSGIESVMGSRPTASETGEPVGTSELLLLGSVDRDQGRFKISANLLRRPEDLLIWSIAMQQSEFDDSDAVQQRFSNALTAVLRCAFGSRSAAKDDPSADLFAKFLQWCAVSSGLDGNLSQLEGLANQIVETAPQYAISYAIKALTNGILVSLPAVSMVLTKPEEEQARLRKVVDEAAEAALKMEPQNKRAAAFAYLALAFKYHGSSHASESLPLLEKSVGADPEFGLAGRFYAGKLSQLGRIDESRNEFERAAGATPHDPWPAAHHAELVAAYGNVAAGRQELADIERRTGTDLSYARFWLEYWYGDPKAARTYVQSGHIAGFVLPGWREDTVPQCLDALLDARVNRVPLSQAQFVAVCTSATPSFPAVFEAERGDVDAAYGELNTWAGWYEQIWEAAQTLYLPHMRSVRADRRFMPFAEKLGLVDYWLDSGHWPDFCTTEELPYDCKEAALAARANAAK